MEAGRKDNHLDPLFVPVCCVCDFIELHETEDRFSEAGESKPRVFSLEGNTD